MKMKELERRSGVSRETIRFYLNEGLLPQPERPYPRVAIYSQVHLNKIRQIRTLQRDPNLTLGLIKRLLAGQPLSDTVATEGFDARIAGRIGPALLAPIEVSALVAEDPIDRHYIDELAALGVITVRTDDDREWLDAIEAEIVRVWAHGRQVAGFRDDLGFGPAGILPYVTAIDSLVRTARDAFLYRVADKVDDDKILEMAEAGMSVVDRLLPLLFRQAMLRVAREHKRTRARSPASA